MFSSIFKYFKTRKKDSMLWFWLFAAFVLFATIKNNEIEFLIFIVAPLLISQLLLMFSFADLWFSLYKWVKYDVLISLFKPIILILFGILIVLFYLNWINTAECWKSFLESQGCGAAPIKVVAIIKSIIPLSFTFSFIFFLMGLNSLKIRNRIRKIENKIDEDLTELDKEIKDKNKK